MQAHREGKAMGVEQTMRLMHLSAMQVPEKSIADFPVLNRNDAAMVVIGWNDCRAALLKSMGITA